MNAIIGQPINRVDGPAKVTGQAIYAAEFGLRNLAYAALVHSTIARGRIERLESAPAERAPGVLTVISHLNAARLPYASLEKRPPVDPKAGEQLHVFQSPDILFVGQPIAVVVAETVERRVQQLPWYGSITTRRKRQRICGRSARSRRVRHRPRRDAPAAAAGTPRRRGTRRR